MRGWRQEGGYGRRARISVTHTSYGCRLILCDVQDAWKHSIILRSSIIFGPEPPEPVARALFLSWLVS